MRLHHIFLITSLFFLFFSFKSSLADYVHDSETSREAIVNSTRTKRFTDSVNMNNSFFALGGSYDNDQNSRQYQITSRYFQQSYRFINEINFLHETEFNDRGSGAKKEYKTKTSELYDISLSSKARAFDTRNYMVLYHRTVKDRFANYGKDSRNAIGFGRMFFDDRVEFDLSVGRQASQNFGEQTEIIPSIRINLKLSDKITLNQRGYLFIDSKSNDSDLRTSLIYRLGGRTSFEIRHTFEQRRYIDGNREVNNVRNLFAIGFVFDLT
jgi:hypothetical protein